MIVTASLPPDLFAWADGLRRAHYPPERNRVPAHVTLFRALPASAGAELRQVLAAQAARHAPIAGAVTGLLDLGQGTALALASPGLLALREALADHFHGLLTAQDRPSPRLHLTIQNKVPPAQARSLQARLRGEPIERRFAFVGLALQSYRGGPWEAAGSWSFRGRPALKRGG
nr:2'-5' RNA ligase family protein [Novosphingobium piscinae]